MKKDIARLTIRLPKDDFDALNKLAASKHISVSELMRNFINKGLAIDGHKEGIDFIRRHIREEINNAIVPRMERLIKL